MLSVHSPSSAAPDRRSAVWLRLLCTSESQLSISSRSAVLHRAAARRPHQAGRNRAEHETDHDVEEALPIRVEIHDRRSHPALILRQVRRRKLDHPGWLRLPPARPMRYSRIPCSRLEVRSRPRPRAGPRLNQGRERCNRTEPLLRSRSPESAACRSLHIGVCKPAAQTIPSPHRDCEASHERIVPALPVQRGNLKPPRPHALAPTLDGRWTDCAVSGHLAGGTLWHTW